MISNPRGPCVSPVSQPTFSPASILADTIVRTVELGVTITDAAIDGETTVVWCDLIADGPGRCPGCGTVGTYRGSVERRLTDLPVAGHPLVLRVRVPRYRCPAPTCERVIFSRDTSRVARTGGVDHPGDHPALRPLRAAPAGRRPHHGRRGGP